MQTVTCLATTQSHLVSGSEDSNLHVWSLPALLSLTSTEPSEPLRSLQNHRASVTNVALGHSASNTNICVSSSKDNTVIVWNYLSGDLLRTYLLPSTPLSLALEPCDRAVYVGFEDGSVQLIEFVQHDSADNPLYDTRLQTTPVQVTLPPWVTPNQSDTGPALCVGLNYDGTCLLTGHASGKIAQWDTGLRNFSGELADLNAPVTNLIMLSPLPSKRLTNPAAVVKPKLGAGNYTFTAQLSGSLETSPLDHTLRIIGFTEDQLENAMARLTGPVTSSSSSPSGDEELRKENAELLKVINQQRELQKKTWDKYTKLKGSKA